jgi:hypothetical protein
MAVEGAKRNSFKIGWAFNPQARRREFNLAALPEIGGLRYRLQLEELWDTARQAYQMEQAILRQFDRYRHPANREILYEISPEELTRAWTDYVHQAHRPRATSVSK